MKSTLATENTELLISELDVIESVIDSAEALLHKLKQRQFELAEALDYVTSPSSVTTVGAIAEGRSPLVPIADSGLQSDRCPGTGFVYKGIYHLGLEKIGIYKELLGELLQDFPERQSVILAAFGGIGRTRTYLARNRGDLFTGKNSHWIKKHSEALGDAWFIDTNLSGLMIGRLLRAAVDAVGLKWNKDVVVRF